jgi:hypothetical protein
MLSKLISGSPLVRPYESAPRAALRIAGTLRPTFSNLGVLFDAFDASAKWAKLGAEDSDSEWRDGARARVLGPRAHLVEGGHARSRRRDFLHKCTRHDRRVS